MKLQFFLKRGDLGRSIRYTLQAPDGSAIDLTGASVRFLMSNHETGASVVAAAATIVTPTSGIVQYDWQANDVLAAGIFDGEFEVTYPDSRTETFPNYSYIEIIISGDLG